MRKPRFSQIEAGSVSRREPGGLYLELGYWPPLGRLRYEETAKSVLKDSSQRSSRV